MRFVPVQSLREDSILKKPIFSTTGNILLREGVLIKRSYIELLKEYGINGVYIDDDISKDIEIVSTISESLKNEAIKTLKKSFIIAKNANPGIKEMSEQSSNVSKMVENIIDEILSNKNFMLNMIDLKVFDDYTFYHSVSVTTISIMIGINLGLNKYDLTDLGVAALLHDLGKVFTPIEILNKKGQLNDLEWSTMKGHAYDGYRYLKDKFSVSSRVAVAVLQHHERWDGSGYPNGAKGNEISLFARIISIADVYDALVSDRPYRKGLLPSEALEYIMGGGGSYFDSEIVRVFFESVAPYPDGTVVRLSNNKVGIVIKNFKGRGSRPVVRIFMENEIKVPEYEIDLSDTNIRTVTIVGIENM